MKPLPLALAAAAVAAFTVPSRADLPRYVFRELPTLGGDTSAGFDVNDAGLVVGVATRHGEFYEVACVWPCGPGQDGLPRYVTGSGGSVATNNSVNQSGVYAGISDILNLAAYTGSFSGVAASAVPLAAMGSHWGEIIHINDGGDLVGQWSGFGVSGWQPFVVRAGVFTALPTLGGLQGAARGISNMGHIVGVADPAVGLPLPVRWINNQAQELPGLGGWGQANAVNDSGVAVGYTSAEGSNPFIAAIWSADNHLTPLPPLVSHWDHRALDINNAGQVVGTSGNHAFLYERGTITDLATLVRLPTGAAWTLASANGIGESGMIVGEGTRNGYRRGFLLTPRCPADYTADGLLTPQDIFAFLDAFFASSPDADFDHGGGITPQDIFAFLSAWFAGC